MKVWEKNVNRIRKGYGLLRKGEFSEFLIRSLKTIIASIEKHQRNARGYVKYEDSSYYQRIVKNPRIRLGELGKKKARLNIIIPQFDKEASYGGIRSAMELAFQLSMHYDSIRFISVVTLKKGNLFDFNDYVVNPSQKNIEIVSLYDNEEIICHENEIFLCTSWETVMVWESYSEVLTRVGLRRNAFYYFIQDFEPGFFPFGYNYTLVQKTYSYPGFTHAIFNSQELYDFFKISSFSFEKEYIVKPSLDTSIFNYLLSRNYKLKQKDKKGIQILMYGRPNPRNCFESIVEGLSRFFRSLSPDERMKYSIVSAGASHDNILLLPDVLIKNLGKLPMEKYIEELEKSHIGISFMVSPHPSYPPLEMATFGLYTITNKFFNKDLSTYHPLIHSLDYPLSDELANELKKAVDYMSKINTNVANAVVPSNMCLSSWRENIGRIGIEPIVSNNLELPTKPYGLNCCHSDESEESGSRSPQSPLS